LDAFHTLRTASTIAYVAGGVLAAGGLVLVLVAPRKSAASSTVVPTVTPIVGFGTFALRGSF
ncbi:hypothetical protein, partial [Klebsiella pneumoniae]|uniref:hypothetical protein n=1 Tax=Klebsiella pneumoniae TaxID=573 RepID=UPI003EE28AC9